MTPSFCAEVTDQVRPVPGSVSSMSTSVAAPVPLLVTVIVNTAGWPALIVPLVSVARSGVFSMSQLRAGDDDLARVVGLGCVGRDRERVAGCAGCLRAVVEHAAVAVRRGRALVGVVVADEVTTTMMLLPAGRLATSQWSTLPRVIAHPSGAARLTPFFCAEVTDQVRPVPGSVSSMSTFVAAPVPLFVTVIVNTAGWPALIVPSTSLARSGVFSTSSIRAGDR